MLKPKYGLDVAMRSEFICTRSKMMAGTHLHARKLREQISRRLLQLQQSNSPEVSSAPCHKHQPISDSHPASYQKMSSAARYTLSTPYAFVLALLPHETASSSLGQSDSTIIATDITGVLTRIRSLVIQYLQKLVKPGSQDRSNCRASPIDPVLGVKIPKHNSRAEGSRRIQTTA